MDMDTDTQAILANLFNQPTRLWGVVNLTPDSFSDGGQFVNVYNSVDIPAVVAYAKRLVTSGAHVLDIGAESTRPGAQAVVTADEQARLLPALAAIRQALPHIPISVDTRRATTADKALAAGATLINDVSGFQYDRDMPTVVAQHQAGVVIMHSQGTPATMQANPSYTDVSSEVLAFLQQQTDVALQAGIQKQHIMWDVGFGFGKTVDHNVSLFHNMHTFNQAGYPVLAGLSRKSFLANLVDTTHPPAPTDRDHLSVTAMILAWQQGIRDFRVHHVEQHHQAINLIQQLTPMS